MRWRGGAARVVRRQEYAVVDLAIALENVASAAVAKLIQLLRIPARRLRKIGECERKDVGVHQSHHRNAERLCKGTTIDEAGVAEMGVPVKIVVDRMIDASLVFAPKTEVERRDAQVLKKRREVRPRAQRANPKIGAVARVAPLIRRTGTNASHAYPLADGYRRFRILDVVRHAADELFERVRSLHAEITAAVRVGVEVRHRVRRQLSLVRLHPFRGAEQARLLAVPGGVDDRALRSPALGVQRTHRARLFQLGHEPGDRILGTIDPGVVVVATNDPLVGFAGSGESGNHIV